MMRWAMAVGALGVAAVSFEVTSRLEDRIRFGTPLTSPYRSQADLAVRDAQGMHGRANARFQKWSLNDLGMRGPAATRRPAPGVRRVITCGASETFGLYESPGAEYPRQLADSLGAAFDVLNAAFPGMSLPTITQDVRLRLAALAPSVIVLYPTPVQYLAAERPTAAPPDSTGRSAMVPASWAWTPRALDRVRDQVKGMLPSPVATALRRRDIAAERARMGAAPFTAVPADRLAAFEHDLRDFVGTVRAAGATPVLTTHANAFGGGAGDAALLTTWERQYPRAEGATILAFEDAAAGVVRRVAADSAVALVDLRAELAGSGRAVFADYAHFTDAGSARVAGALARALRRLGGAA